MRANLRTALGGLHAGLLVLFASSIVTGCSSGDKVPKSSVSGPAAATPLAETAATDAIGDEPLPPLAYESALPKSVRSELNRSFTGDLDDMVKRRLVRVGVPYNRTLYFVDQGVQRGAAYEYGKLMEDELNKRRQTGNLKVSFWFVPLPRDQLLPALVDGKVDFVIAGLTDTPERRKLVAFTKPTRQNVSEIVVTGPSAPTIASVDDLSGQEVFVRKSSSYHRSLQALNVRLTAEGREPVAIRDAPESLEDDDLLEMTNAGLIKITVTDSHVTDLWRQVFTDLVVHDDMAISTGGNLAVAFRKNNPQVGTGLNAIIDAYGLGTSFGNMMEKRYLKSTQFVKNAASEVEIKKFQDIAAYFKKYSEQYDVDYLLMAAQGYQESRLDQTVKSPVGAIGVMQVMPATAKDLNVGDVRGTEANIHAGVKYMRWVVDHYFKDEPMDSLNKGLFAFASYNAGPGRVRQLRKEAENRGLDPNVWFGNVEQVASERIGRETVTYVSNIFKYYIAYRLVVEENARRAAAKQSIRSEAIESRK